MRPRFVRNYRARIGLTATHAQQPKVLQALSDHPGPTPAALRSGASFYVPATVATVRWGYLPDATSAPVLTVPSGSIVTFDTLSHEGLLEDQGLNPTRFFGRFGVPSDHVLADAQRIADLRIPHDFRQDGPHIVIGPVEVTGAEPGDLLRIDLLAFTPRVPYGIVGARHGKGALAGELPTTAADPSASAEHPELFHSDFHFVSLNRSGKTLQASLRKSGGGAIPFPADPFLGIIGLAPGGSGSARISSTPPGDFGGNLDIRNLTAGATLYLPVQVPGAKLFVADPHFAQGNGEVSLTAVEGSLRATLRLTVLKFSAPGYPSRERLTSPFAETRDFWIPIGLDPDLDEALRKAVRNAIDYLTANHNLDRATAYSYLSAATDFNVSQVVNRTKGIHGLVRKRDFLEVK